MNEQNFSNPAFSHQDLVALGVKWLKRRNFGVILDDGFSTHTTEKPDVIGWRQNVSVVIEAKTSRSDFNADKKKPHRMCQDAGMGDWRFFICCKELISADEIPSGWGLLWVESNGKIQEVKGVPPNTQWYSRKPFPASNKEAEMALMYAALRRLQPS